jgi:hypothetical protein
VATNKIVWEEGENIGEERYVEVRIIGRESVLLEAGLAMAFLTHIN